VLWRFSDAGRQSARIGSAFQRPKTCTKPDVVLDVIRKAASEISAS
jgi:hypothetical protein